MAIDFNPHSPFELHASPIVPPGPVWSPSSSAYDSDPDDAGASLRDTVAHRPVLLHADTIQSCHGVLSGTAANVADAGSTDEPVRPHGPEPAWKASGVVRIPSMPDWDQPNAPTAGRFAGERPAGCPYPDSASSSFCAECPSQSTAAYGDGPYGQTAAYGEGPYGQTTAYGDGPNGQQPPPSQGQARRAFYIVPPGPPEEASTDPEDGELVGHAYASCFSSRVLPVPPVAPVAHSALAHRRGPLSARQPPALQREDCTLGPLGPLDAPPPHSSYDLPAPPTEDQALVQDAYALAPYVATQFHRLSQEITEARAVMGGLRQEIQSAHQCIEGRGRSAASSVRASPRAASSSASPLPSWASGAAPPSWGSPGIAPRGSPGAASVSPSPWIVSVSTTAAAAAPAAPAVPSSSTTTTTTTTLPPPRPRSLRDVRDIWDDTDQDGTTTPSGRSTAAVQQQKRDTLGPLPTWLSRKNGHSHQTSATSPSPSPSPSPRPSRPPRPTYTSTFMFDDLQKDAPSRPQMSNPLGVIGGPVGLVGGPVGGDVAGIGYSLPDGPVLEEDGTGPMDRTRLRPPPPKRREERVFG